MWKFWFMGHQDWDCVWRSLIVNDDDGDDDDDDDGDGDNVGENDDDDGGYPAYSHHDRFPPWWVFVRDDNGGNLSGDKIPP